MTALEDLCSSASRRRMKRGRSRLWFASVFPSCATVSVPTAVKESEVLTWRPIDTDRGDTKPIESTGELQVIFHFVFGVSVLSKA